MYNQSPQLHCRTLGDVCSNLLMFQILYSKEKFQNKSNSIGFKLAAFLASYMKSSDTHTHTQSLVTTVSSKTMNYSLNVFSF